VKFPHFEILKTPETGILEMNMEGFRGRI